MIRIYCRDQDFYFRKNFTHFLIYLPIWLIPHRKIDPRLLIYDTLIVGECIKTDLPMVSAHATFTEAAEAHFCGGKVDDGVVDASSAETAA